MHILFKASLPILGRARFCRPILYYNFDRVSFKTSKMVKRKRSSIAAGAKETPGQLSTQTSATNNTKSASSGLESAAKEPKQKRAKPDPKPKANIPDFKIKDGVEGLGDPEAEVEELADEEELKEALSRPPPVNSNYLPLPWNGRLGYVRYDPYNNSILI
jgi:hypothetical protein